MADESLAIRRLLRDIDPAKHVLMTNADESSLEIVPRAVAAERLLASNPGADAEELDQNLAAAPGQVTIASWTGADWIIRHMRF